MEGILGRESRLVQSPLSMSDPKPLFHPHKTKSVDTHDRKPLEGALVVKGVHREIDTGAFDSSLARPNDLAATAAASVASGLPFTPTKNQTIDTFQGTGDAIETPRRNLNAHPEEHRSPTSTKPRDIEKSKDHGKGHAHNPLEDHLFLEIGPGGTEEIPDPPAVSESPPAAGLNIYEAAYKQEIKHIREKRGRKTLLYLTRRVDDKEYLDDENIVSGIRDAGPAAAKSGFAKLVDLAKKKDDQGKEGEEKKGK